MWEHFERGGDAAPREADRPGEEDSGMSFSPSKLVFFCEVDAMVLSSSERIGKGKPTRDHTVWLMHSRFPRGGIPAAFLRQRLRGQ